MDDRMMYLLLKLAGFAFLIQICTSNEFHYLDDVDFVEDDHPHDKCTRRRMDVVFILDESSSIPPAVFRKEKRFVAQMLRQFDIGVDGTRVGVLTFADMTRVHVNLKDFGPRHKIWSQVKKIRQFGGNTNTGEALRILRTYAFHPAQGARVGTPVPQICIVVTDGGSQRHDLTKIQAMRAKAKGFIMFSVGVGPDSNEEELHNIASDIHYILSHEDHVHAAEVSCDATLPPPRSIIPGCADNPIDLVFVLDNSNSIPHGSYDKMMEFVADMVMGFNIGEDATRVALIKFASDAILEFTFNSFFDREDASDAIRTTNRLRGGTYTYYALRMIETELLLADRGAREGIQKVAMVITDGNSANKRHTLWQAKVLREKYNFRFFALGVGNDIDISELYGIVGPNNEADVFLVETFDHLIEFSETMVLKSCGNAPSRAPPIIAKKVDIGLTRAFKPHSSNPIAKMNKETRLKFDLKIQNVANTDIEPLPRGEKNYAVDFYFSQANLQRTPIRRTRVHKLNNIVEPGLEFGLIGNGPASSLITFDTSGTLPGRECSRYIWFCACVREGEDAKYRDADDRNNCQCRPAEELISCSPDIMVANFDPKGKEYLRGEETELDDISLNVKNGANREPGNNILKAKRGDNYKIQLVFAKEDLAKNPNAKKTPPFPTTLKTGDLSVALDAARITPQQRMKAKVMLPDEDDCAQYLWLCACVSEASGADYKDANPNNNCECKDVSPFMKCVFLPLQKIFDGCFGKVADVFFIVDSSSGIKDADYQSVLEFAQLMTLGMDIGRSKTRVGVISVADRPAVAFQLNKYSDREATALAIPKVRRQRGRSNKMADALIMMQEYNAARYGGREGALKVGIVITSGPSADMAKTRAEAKKARDNGYILFAIGADNFDFDELEGIADIPFSETRLFTSYSYKRLSRNVPAVVEEMCRLKPAVIIENPDLALNDFVVADESPIMVMDKDATMKMNVVLGNKEGADIKRLNRREKNYALDFYISEDNLEVTPKSDTRTVFLKNVKEPNLNFGLIAKGSPSSLLKFDTEGKLPVRRCNNLVWFCACAREGSDAPWIDADNTNNCKCQDAKEKISCSPDIKVTNFDPKKNEFLRGEATEIGDLALKVQNAADRQPGNDIFKAKTGDNFAIDLHFAQADLAKNPRAVKTPPFPATLKTGDLSVALKAASVTGMQKMKAKVTLPDEDGCAQYVWLCACVREARGAEYNDANPNNNCECKDVSPFMKCVFLPQQPIFDGCVGKVADVFFLVDSSSRIKDADYQKVLEFAQLMALGMDIAEAKTRVGVISVADRPAVAFQLNKYFDREDAALAIPKVRRQRGRSNKMAEALIMMQEYNAARYGGRAGALKVGIVITSGPSADMAKTRAEAKKARDNGYILFAIGADNFDFDELEGIADIPYSETRLFTSYSYKRLSRNVPAVVEEMCRLKPVKNPDLALNDFVVADESPIMVMDKDATMKMNVVLGNKEGADIKRLNRGKKNYALDFYISEDNLEVTPKSDTRTVFLKNVKEPNLNFGLIAKGSPSSLLKFDTEGKLPVRRCNNLVWFCACAREGSDAPWIDADNKNNCKCQDAKEKISCSPDIKVTNFDPKKNEFLRGEATEIDDLALKVQNAADRQPGNDIFKAKTGDNFAIDLHFAQADLAKNPRAVKTPPFPATLKTGDLSVALKAASVTGMQKMKAKVTLPDEDGCAQYVWLCACVREARGAEYNDANPNNNCECKDVSPFMKCVFLPQQPIFDGCVGKVADVFFLVDSSSRMKDADYQKVLEFAQLMALGMDIAEAKTRVGVISVADRPAVAFQLNKYFDREDAALAIPKVRRQRGRSNKMAEALIMMQEYNAARYGGRAKALKVGIVITSGPSADMAKTRAEAKKARDNGYILFAIGADNFDFDELEGIADIPYSETRLFTSYSYKRLSRNVPAVVEEMCRLKPPAPNPDLVLNDFKVGDDNLPMVVDQETDLPMNVVLENKAGGNIKPLRWQQKNYAVDFYVSQANLVITPLADTTAVLLKTVREPSLDFGLDAKGAPSSLLKFGTRGKLPSDRCNKYVWFCACAREGTDAPWKDADNTNNCKCNDASEKISCAPDIQVADFLPNADGKTFKGEAVELSNINAKVKNSGPRKPGNNIQKAKGGDNFAIDLHFAQADLAVNPKAKKSPAFPATVETGDLSVALRAGGSTADQKLKSTITHPANECEKYVWLCACVREASAAKYKDSNTNNNCECKDVSPQVKCGGAAAACKGKPVDVVFVIDNSNSIRNNDYVHMMDFVEALISAFDIGVDKARIGLVTFASDTLVRFELNKFSDSGEIIQFVDGLRRQHGGTQTGDALEETREHTFQEEHGARPGVLKVALVITDGISANRRQTLAEAKITRDHGIRVYAIGIGPGVDQSELLGIAGSENPQQVFSSDTFEALTTLRERIIQDTCSATPAPPHVVSCKDTPSDVVFIIDNSNSIRRGDYVKMIDFVETLVGSFDIGLDKTRIGVVTYASEALVRFELNKYGTSSEIVEFVDTMRRQHGGTQTGDALEEAREHTFKTEHGARPNVVKVAIVITDGVSANRQQTLAEAKITRDRGIKVFAVGIGPGVDRSELVGIAGAENPGHVFSAATFEALEVLIESIVKQTCAGGHMFADAPAGQLILLPPCEATPSDVVFILDNSASVQSDEYRDMIKFAKSVVSEFNIGTRLNQTKVAAVTFASAARVGFYLNENRYFMDYAKSFNEIRRLYGRSNTADALRIARVSALSPFRGARPRVQKLVVLITDGKSNNREQTVAQASLNLAEGIETVVIGVGKRISTKELHTIVGRGQGRRILTVERFRDLPQVKADVVKARCSRG